MQYESRKKYDFLIDGVINLKPLEWTNAVWQLDTSFKEVAILLHNI